MNFENRIQQSYNGTDIQNVPLIQRIYEYHQSIIQKSGEFISNKKIRAQIK